MKIEGHVSTVSNFQPTYFLNYLCTLRKRKIFESHRFSSYLIWSSLMTYPTWLRSSTTFSKCLLTLRISYSNKPPPHFLKKSVYITTYLSASSLNHTTSQLHRSKFSSTTLFSTTTPTSPILSLLWANVHYGS